MDALRLDTICAFLHWLYVGWFDNGRPPTRHFRAFPTPVIRRLVRQWTPSDSTLSVHSYTGYTSAGLTMDALRLDTSVRFLHRLYVSWFDNERPLTRHYLCAPTKATRLIHSIALIKKDLVRGPTHRSRRSEGPQPRTTDGKADVLEDRPLVGRTRRRTTAPV